MSIFRWNREAQRVRKMAKDIDAMRDRLWKSDSDDLGWGMALLSLCGSLEATADQMELQIDQRPKRVMRLAK